MGGDAVFDRVAAATEAAEEYRALVAIACAHGGRPLLAGAADLGKVQDSLRQMKPGLTDANLAEAVQTAREVVNHGRGIHKKILVLSDEQKSGWQIDNASAWKLALGDGAGN